MNTHAPNRAAAEAMQTLPSRLLKYLCSNRSIPPDEPNLFELISQLGNQVVHFMISTFGSERSLFANICSTYKL